MSSPQLSCQSFQCSGERCYQDEAHSNMTTTCYNETFCEVWSLERLLEAVSTTPDFPSPLSHSVHYFCSSVMASLRTSSGFLFFPLALLLQLYRFSSMNYTARCSSVCSAELCRTNGSVTLQQCTMECCNTSLCLQLNASSYGNCSMVYPAACNRNGCADPSCWAASLWFLCPSVWT